MKPVTAILVLAILMSASIARAQRCPPVSVFYIVRGDDGKPLSETELRSIYEQSPAPIGYARTGMNSVTVAENGKYQSPGGNGGKVPALSFVGSADECKMHLTEVTLVYHKKKMRLIFNIDFPYGHPLPRNIIIDSVKFQGGTFELELDLGRLPPEDYPTISPQHWTKVKKTNTDTDN